MKRAMDGGENAGLRRPEHARGKQGFPGSGGQRGGPEAARKRKTVGFYRKLCYTHVRQNLTANQRRRCI